VIPELEVADSPLRLVGQVLVSPGLARCSVGTLPLLWVAGDRAIVEQDEIQKSSPVAGCLEILSMPRACGRTSVLVDDMHPACSTAEWANFAFVIDLRDTALLPVGDDGGCYLESKKCYIVPAPADSSVYCRVAEALGLSKMVAPSVAFTNASTQEMTCAVAIGPPRLVPRPTQLQLLDAAFGVPPLDPWASSWCFGPPGEERWLPPSRILVSTPKLGSFDDKLIGETLVKCGLPPAYVQELGFV